MLTRCKNAAGAPNIDSVCLPMCHINVARLITMWWWKYVANAKYCLFRSLQAAFFTPLWFRHRQLVTNVLLRRSWVSTTGTRSCAIACARATERGNQETVSKYCYTDIYIYIQSFLNTMPIPRCFVKLLVHVVGMKAWLVRFTLNV